MPVVMTNVVGGISSSHLQYTTGQSLSRKSMKIQTNIYTVVTVLGTASSFGLTCSALSLSRGIQLRSLLWPPPLAGAAQVSGAVGRWSQSLGEELLPFRHAQDLGSCCKKRKDGCLSASRIPDRGIWSLLEPNGTWANCPRPIGVLLFGVLESVGWREEFRTPARWSLSPSPSFCILLP